MQLDEIVEEWLRRAQQAVEKSLKAILVSTGIDPPRTHDLVFLHTLCIERAKANLRIVDLCARLTPYAVDQRYPINSDFDDEQLVRDVDAAESFTFAIRKKLGTTESPGP